MIEVDIAQPPADQRTSIVVFNATHAEHSSTSESRGRSLSLTRTRARQPLAQDFSGQTYARYACSDYRAGQARDQHREWRVQAPRWFAAAASWHLPYGKSSPPELFHEDRRLRSSAKPAQAAIPS